LKRTEGNERIVVTIRSGELEDGAMHLLRENF